MEISAWVLRGLGVYLALGAGFAVWFVIDGVGRISPATRGTGWGFRLLIAPGSAALWPLLAFELVASGGRGGMVVGRPLHADDIETSFDDETTVDGGQIADLPVSGRPDRYVDPEAETDAGPAVGEEHPDNLGGRA